MLFGEFIHRDNPLGNGLASHVKIFLSPVQTSVGPKSFYNGERISYFSKGLGIS